MLLQKLRFNSLDKVKVKKLKIPPPNTVDKLYVGLNNYHPKVKLTIEFNPLRFPDRIKISRYRTHS